MAAISVKRNSFVSRFKTLLSSQCLYHSFAEVGTKPRLRSEKASGFELGEINTSKWKKMDSRSLGITGKLPSSPYTLIKILRSRGFEAYLVGGCVRDLLLNRTPKDFDVITTADLNQIKKQFHRCIIVGRRFPICMVHIKGSVIEVSSFKTLAKHSENKEKFLVSKMPRVCDKSDLKLWKNSMHRDFTVNSLFFDPIIHKIYDYNNGMKDLLELKLRTLVPANESFAEDCARILRGLRLAARLGLSFSKDVETAIHKHASSILTLSSARIMMEMNYMLSYGAAESSLRLLHRFHILEILLPFQAAYISRQTTGSGQDTMMLMKLFSHMDKFVSCDKPSACCLWIGLLAFHQALLKEPQHPFVVLTFGSVLYHQSWEDGLSFARKCGQPPVSFDPETLDPYTFISDDEVTKRVKELARKVINSIDILVDGDIQHNEMSKFPDSPCSGLVFISKNAAHGTAKLFHVLSHKLQTYSEGRSSFEMNHQLLVKGDTSETRFVVGNIIMNTMGCGINNHPESPANIHVTTASDSSLQKMNAESSSTKKQNAATEIPIKEIADTDYAIEKPEETRVSKSPIQELVATLETIIEDEDLPSQLGGQNPKEKVNAAVDAQVDQSTTKEESVDRKGKRKQVLQLSSLFK